MVFRGFFGLCLPSFELCEPGAELQQAELQEGSFSTCPTVCLSVSSIFVLYQSAKPRGHSVEKGTDCSCAGSHLESWEVFELFGPDLVVTCDSADFFQKVLSDTIILSGISGLMNASQSLVLDQ